MFEDAFETSLDFKKFAGNDLLLSNSVRILFAFSTTPFVSLS